MRVDSDLRRQKKDGCNLCQNMLLQSKQIKANWVQTIQTGLSYPLPNPLYWSIQ